MDSVHAKPLGNPCLLGTEAIKGGLQMFQQTAPAWPRPCQGFLLWTLYASVDRPVCCLWLGDLRPWHLLSPVTQNSNICCWLR